MQLARLVCAILLMATAIQSPCADSPTAAQRFAELEGLLARAGRFDINAHVVSHGTVESDLTVSLGVANEGDVAIRMQGSLKGKPENFMLRSDGVVTIVTHDGTNQRMQPGRAMRQAVQVGFLRMGLMHNLMLLTQLQQPEHQGGGIDSWVQAEHIHYASKKQDGQIGLSFDLVVDGKQSGHATLWIDSKTHVPLRREQSIVLNGEKINTIEDYSNFIPTA